MFTSRPALRWIVPVAALAVVAGVTGTVVRADAAGALPPRSAKQLLVDLQTANPGSFSGTVVQQAKLGLPELPAVSTDEGSSDLSSLVSGNHTLKVWYDGPQRVRLALLGTLGESDVIRNGRDVWMWSSTEKSAQHRVLPAGSTKPGSAIPDVDQLPRTPQEAADQALAALDPSTKVTTDGTARVAGLDAYQLVLSPRDKQSLVGQIRLAIDAKSHLPLQVQVYARGVAEPEFQVGFTRISFGRPSADHFAFSPPPGTKVEQVKPGIEGKQGTQGKQSQKERRQADKSKAQAEPAFVGKGWLTVVVARTPEPAQKSGAPGELGAIMQTLPKVSGDWGSGRVLKGALFTVLFTDDGRVLAGAVAPERLYSVARTTR